MQVKTIKFMGATVELNPMDTAPRDGTGILVLLESESLGRMWHTASLRPNISIVGHMFAFDCPKIIGWVALPIEEVKGSEPPYIEHTVIHVERAYNSSYGDARICTCGHSYSRHFDPFEDDKAVGCKYCGCYTFVEETNSNG